MLPEISWVSQLMSGRLASPAIQNSFGESPLQVFKLSTDLFSGVFKITTRGSVYGADNILFPEISNDTDTSFVEVLWAISVAGILSLAIIMTPPCALSSLSLLAVIWQL